MAYQCVSASDQYFTYPSLGVTFPPMTLSLWINVSSVVANKHTHLFTWRGSVNTEFFLFFASSQWELRYSISGGAEYLISTGLYASPGAWQHACLAVSTTQARLYLGGANYTNTAAHSTAAMNATGYIAKDPIADGLRVSFNGSIAEAAIWNATLSGDECLALSKRLSPLALTSRLHDLLLYKDFIRDLNRGCGPALTAVNAPAVSSHPPLAYPGIVPQIFPPREFAAPYRAAAALTDANRTIAGCGVMAGVEQGLTHPIGEVSS